MKAQPNPTIALSGGQYPPFLDKPLLTRSRYRGKVQKCGTKTKERVIRCLFSNYVSHVTDYTEHIHYAHMHGYYVALKVCNIGL
jgi:hypothetical protein